MKKISYLDLQKKFAGKIVALDKREKKVVAFGRKFARIFKELTTKNISPKECIFAGPIQKAGTINVYLISLSKKINRGR